MISHFVKIIFTSQLTQGRSEANLRPIWQPRDLKTFAEVPPTAMVGLFPAHFINKQRNKSNYDNRLLVFPSSLAEPNIKFYEAVILDGTLL